MQIDNLNYLYLILPMFGILFSVLFVKLIKKDLQNGIPKVLHAISRKNSILKVHKLYSFITASSLTVGFGGSVGLEAPIVVTGSAIGSNLAKLFHLNYRSKTLLLGCGAAASISAIFNAPIAGVIFSLEVIMLDLTMSSLIPLLIASVSGAILAKSLYGEEILLNFILKDEFMNADIPFYIFLGILTGFISLYFVKINNLIENILLKIKNDFLKVIAGGISLGFLIFLFPPLFGEGFDILLQLVNESPNIIFDYSVYKPLKDSTNFSIQENFILLSLLLLIILFKAFTTSITRFSGGIGGIFAPSLFIGGITGCFVAQLINTIGIAEVSVINFTLVGMAGAIAGIQYSPLTAIFLIAEITNGYELILPLMLTSIISYLTCIYFERHSIYTKQLAKKGELITHNKDKAALNLININKLIEKEFIPLHPDGTLRDIANAVSKSKRNLFPVIDNNNHLIGIITLDDIRHIMFNQNLFDKVMIKELLHPPP